MNQENNDSKYHLSNEAMRALSEGNMNPVADELGENLSVGQECVVMTAYPGIGMSPTRELIYNHKGNLLIAFGQDRLKNFSVLASGLMENSEACKLIVKKR